MAEPVLFTELVLPKGDKGDPGEPGPPGPNTVPTNDAIAAAVTTPGPAKTALDSAIAGVVRTAAHDQFLGEADGPLLAGTIADSSQPYTVRANPSTAGFKRVGGSLTHTLPASGVAAAYAGLELGEDVSSIWANFLIPSGSGTAESIVLIVSSAQFTVDTGLPASAAHLVVNQTGWSYETLDVPFATPVVSAGQFATPLPVDTELQLAVQFRGDRASIVLPNGEVVLTPANAKILSQRGAHATLELYTSSSATAKAIRVLAWGADDAPDVGEVSRSGPGLYDLGRALDALPKGRPLGTSFFLTNSSDIPIGTDRIEIMRSSTLRIARSKKVRVTADFWVNELIPTTQATRSLLVGAFVDGNESYGSMVRLVDGYSRPNGLGSAHTEGRMYHVELDIDESAFNVGNAYPIIVKAQASASGVFTIRQDTSSQRRNAVAVYEVP
ncbi:hypothetical protein [Microbacterium sp. SORGH_AS_0862]|uniref:hypothetical protein n=1 Tax=Microbacterium sp. SORGH_AS_0862 TaxID=3041789 RepID=UPI0027943AC9|nr:hypothetical protein [Microbacterium sp. SORGH_AS_0862]MDQ1206222.1 hypothetical protein [Microbacterium sp. SORGH_AS_0862]